MDFGDDEEEVVTSDKRETSVADKHVSRKRTYSRDVNSKVEHIFHIVVKSAKLLCDKSVVAVKFNIIYSETVAEKLRIDVGEMTKGLGVPVISSDK